MRSSQLGVLIAIGGLLLPVLVTPTPARASRARVRTLRDISGPSPFDGCAEPKGLCSMSGNLCTTDSDCICGTCFPGETCLDQRGNEFEPDIAVNPVNRRNLIAVYTQDSLTASVVSTTRDRGRHWTQVPVPGRTKCTGGTADEAFDPRVAIGPDGIAYTSSSVVDEPAGPGGPFSQSLLVNRSTDGGLSWSDPVTVDTQIIIDFPVLTADPHRPGTAYLVWNYVSGMPFSRTTDGGATWTPPAIIPIAPTPDGVPAIGQIRVLPDGTLVDLFIRRPSDGSTGVWLVRSTDQGDNWSDPIHVANVPANILKDPDDRRCSDGIVKCTTDDDCGVLAPCSAQPIGAGQSWVRPSVAVGADGTLYAAWHRIESTSSSQIEFVKSVDGGKMWSDPAPVAVETTTQAFLPTVAVSPAGTVGVTFFDFRNDVPGDPDTTPLTTDLWFRHSHDGGATWSETHVAGPFDLRPAPSLGGYPLGDYFGLAPMRRNGFAAALVQTIGPGPEDATDTFFARLRVSPRR